MPTLVHAADSPIGAAVQAFAGLGVVLAIIVGALFLLKRLTPGRFASGGLLKPVATLAVGPRERIVVVELQDTWIVAGVTAQNVTVLHTLPRGTVPDAISAPAPAGSFADALRNALPGTRKE